MAQIDLGKLRFQWQGLWTTATAYEVDDVVHDEGSTYVVVTAVPATNTDRPGDNAAFELMARGVNFRGPWLNTNTYQHLEIVTHNDASWISVVSDPFVGVEPTDEAAEWDLLVPAPDPNVLTTTGDLVTVDNTGATARLPVGDEGTSLTVIKSPRQDFVRLATYTVNTAGTTNAAVLTDADTGNVFGGQDDNAAITLSRGQVYLFTVPNNGLNYSIKDPADPAYATAGNGGRIVDGVTPDFVNNGATIAFSPDENTPNTVVLRDEANGADEVTITIVNMRYVPSWTGASYRDFRADSCQNSWTNIVTQGLLALPEWAQKFGRGQTAETGTFGRKKAAYRSKGGDIVAFGELSYDGTTQTVGYNAYGNDSYPAAGTHNNAGSLTNFRMPTFWFRAISGDPAYAHLLTDLDGNDLGCENIFDVPKVINYELADFTGTFLLANGLLFASGAGAGGHASNNTTPTYWERPVVINFFNNDGTALLGANWPKIKWYASGLTAAVDGLTSSTYTAIDTEGHLYVWGLNTSGALADGTTTTNNIARRVDPALFDNEEIIFSFVNGDADCSVYVITETGRCWAWGNNADGQLGLNDLVDRNQPVEVTAVAGSPLNGQQIIHIMGTSGGTATEHKVWFLTAAGEIYFAGSSILFGAYSGVYNTATTTTQAMPITLTDSATTINDGDHTVVSMWTTGGSSGTQYAVRDDGVLFSWGNNADGQLARNAPLAHGNSATVQGEWFLDECQFSNMGDTFDSTLVANANEDFGPRASFADGEVNEHTLKIGNPVKIIGYQTAATTESPVMMLDDNGQAWICGHWATYNPNSYTELDSKSLTTAGLDFYNVWVPCWSQPEQLTDIALPNRAGKSWWGIGVSGTLYAGGYAANGEATGQDDTCNTGWSVVPITCAKG